MCREQSKQRKTKGRSQKLDLQASILVKIYHSTARAHDCLGIQK